MRGHKFFRVNVLTRRPAQAHSIRGGSWRWNVTVEDSVIASGVSPSMRTMRKEALAVQQEYLRKHQQRNKNDSNNQTRR